MMNILEVHLLTSSLDQTEAFYAQMLGLQLVSKTQNTVSFLVGKSTLTFTASDEQNATYHFAFNIPNHQIEEAVAWLRPKVELMEKAGPGSIADFEDWNAKAIYFYDNNHNIVEFIARFDLPNPASDTPFGSHSILSISEIGIVTDRPLALAEAFSQTYQIPFFSKSSPTESFVVLGDDNGLFIIVANRRNWFPTEQKSQKCFTSIKIEENGVERMIVVNGLD